VAGKLAVVAAVIAAVCISAWICFVLAKRRQMAGRWLPCHLNGVAETSFWETGDDGNRVLITIQPDQPWFDGIGQVSRVAFTRQGEVRLGGKTGEVKGNYSFGVRGDLKLTLRTGSGEKNVVLPIEREGKETLWILDPGRKERIGRYELMAGGN
jgi:hypothetical protein